MLDKIPLCRASIDDSEIAAVVDVLKSGWLTHGPKNTEFEEKFSEYIGIKHAITMNSCTSALFMAILAQGIKGDVLVPSFTFVASANAIKTAGANPVFVDINYHDCNVNPDCLEEYITPATEALMVVHYAGQCCDMEKITAFAEKHSLVLIEDSAETIGGTFDSLKSGSWGTGCYSFFPTKNITTGEGGMFTTNDDDLARRTKTLIGHGIDKSTFQRGFESKPWVRAAVVPGYNFRMSNLLAAIGVEQIKKIEHMNELRRRHSKYLIENLSAIEEINLPVENAKCKHVYQMFTIKVKTGNRDEMLEYLKKNKVEASIHFLPPVHQHPAYEPYKGRALPVTEHVSKDILTLPMFPELAKEHLDTIVYLIKKYFSHG